jgi:transposase
MKFDLTSIPGIGYDIAAIIASELGASLDSFPTEKHFVSYLGLAPSLGKSAGKSVRQKGCKNTSRTGLALRMGASSLHKSSSELGAYFRNVAFRTDRKTAVKATARRMAHMIYRGMKYGKEYIDIGAEAYQSRIRDKKLKTVNKLIKSLNINASELVFQN